MFHGMLLAALIVVPYRWYSTPQAEPVALQTTGGGTKQSARKLPKVTKPDDVQAEHVQAKMQDIQAQLETLTAEEKLSKLDGAAKQLERISNEKSVAELAAKFQTWLNTTPRASKPADGPVAGKFDSNSAQFHDVTREKNEQGEFRYKATLLDAQGRTQEVELSQEDGESTYRTMQLLKANPLAEQVYRQITIPLLDKLLRDSPSLPTTPPTQTPPGQLRSAQE